jgi:hypothetical protein
VLWCAFADDLPESHELVFSLFLQYPPLCNAASICIIDFITVLMGFVACYVVYYRIFCYPAMLFMLYMVVRAYQHSRNELPSTILQRLRSAEVVSPILITMGLFAMHKGKVLADNGFEGTYYRWTVWFWLGETTVLGGFTFNSLASSMPRTRVVIAGIAIFALVASLWFRGSDWNYLLVIGFESFLALFVAVAFPMFEFLLETILNEKLRKVGDKVRAHHVILERHYEHKLAQVQSAAAAARSSDK